MLELGQSRQRGIFETSDRCGRRDPQPDGNGEGLFVVEQERWQFAAGPQAVAATGAGHRFDRIAQAAKPGDIATHRPGGDFETRRQLLGGPVDTTLEQAEQLEQPFCAIHSSWILPGYADRSCPHSIVGSSVADEGDFHARKCRFPDGPPSR
jgi:hypothetical protein